MTGPEAARIRTATVLAVLSLLLLPAATALVAAPEPATMAPQRLALPIPPGALGTTEIDAGLAATSPATNIGPGSHLILQRPDGTFGCTANFVWTTGSAYYLGAAGHCFIPGDATSTHGPDADYDRTRTRTWVCVSACNFGGQLGFIVTGNLVELGQVAYARQTLNGDDVGNDFGIVRIPTSLVGSIRPSMPVWGGPRASGVMAAGDSVCLYGNAGGLGEAFPTMARTGIAILGDDTSWDALIPSFQGDSGAAVVTCNTVDAGGLQGDLAAGILTHLTAAGMAGTSMPRAVEMATEAGLGISLVHASSGVPGGHRVGAVPTFARVDAPVTTAAGAIGASVLALGEAEAYHVQLAAGERFTASIAYGPIGVGAQGVAPDLDVGLWPMDAWESGILSTSDALDRSANEGGVPESIDATAPAAGDYVLVIYGWLVGEDQTFTLGTNVATTLDAQAYLAGISLV